MAVHHTQFATSLGIVNWGIKAHLSYYTEMNRVISGLKTRSGRQISSLLKWLCLCQLSCKKELRQQMESGGDSVCQCRLQRFVLSDSERRGVYKKAPKCANT